MTQRRRLQSLFVVAAILFSLGSGPSQLLAQPAIGPKTVVPANLYVDDDNVGAQDGSATRPFRTVQQAINAAADKAVIAVAGGAYPENIRVQEKTVRLYGGYASNFKTRDPAANPSHLKGNGKDSVVTLYEAGASVVDGFLISGGGPSSVAAPARVGGGCYVYGGSPTISHNVIEKNQSCPANKSDEEARGGGIHASCDYGSGASLTVLNNVIRNNVSGRGAGVFSDGAKLVLRGNLIQNNIGVADHGGGAYLNSPNAEISYNRVEGNEIARLLGYGWGGGMIVVNTGSNYKLSHNVFTGNYAPSLGAGFFVDEGGTATMEHDLVYGNKTKPDGEGAAVFCDGNEGGAGSSLTMNHVTIVDNTSGPGVTGGAVKVSWNSKLVAKNCIFWNNGGDDFDVDDKSKATVTYTLSQETIKGTGNLSKDPLFVNSAGHDYRLKQGSPAIGAAEAVNGARANLGSGGQAAAASPTGSAVKQPTPAATTLPVVPRPMPAVPQPVAPKTIVLQLPQGPAEPTSRTTSKTFLLRGTSGELPSEVGDDNTRLTKVGAPELGGAAVQIDLIDTFGQKVAKVADWTKFETLRLDIVNKGAKDLPVEFNLFHSETKAYATRVVAPFVLKPGKNEVRLAVADLKNSNGSSPQLSEVRRWFVGSETPGTLLVGDIFLEAPLPAPRPAAPPLGGEPTVRNSEQLSAALLRAAPGTTILLAPGRYSSDISVESLRGTPAKPIVIAAADERDPPVFAGGKVAFHFVGCSYITLRSVRVSGCTGNGINADDAGNAAEPSVGMVFENIVIEDIGPTGTRNGLKMSGLDKFAVQGCTFSGWGGSAIDLVGCHDGVVQNCRFLGKTGFSQDTGVQIKGGSERIVVKRNFFKQGGGRAINLGGSTDLEYFRPQVRNYEAKDIEVGGNLIVGSRAPIAFASSIQCTVRHNTIVNPESWVLRILQEQPTDQFLPCQRGVFAANLIVFDRRVRDFANVGEDTKPETFTFAGNAWFCTDADRRPTLPAQETGGIYQVDPLLQNAESPEIKLGSQDPRILKVGAHAFRE